MRSIRTEKVRGEFPNRMLIALVKVSNHCLPADTALVGLDCARRWIRLATRVNKSLVIMRLNVRQLMIEGSAGYARSHVLLPEFSFSVIVAC
jgi:hypothetical protein